MCNKIAVLVTGVGGCGVGEGVAKALLALRKEYRVISCNMHGDAPLLFTTDSAYLVPPAGDSKYIKAIECICARENIRVIVPGSELELLALVESRERFESQGIELIVNSKSVIKIANDKWLTVEFLKTNGFRFPISSLCSSVLAMLEKVDFPIIVKPRTGHGSSNVFVVASKEELDCVLMYFSLKKIEPIIQEMVGTLNEEFTVSVLTGKKGVVIGSIAFRRRLLGGFSQQIELQEFSKIRRQGEKLALALGSCGPLNIQCRVVDGECIPFELNARFSGTTPFRALAGFNEVDILICEWLGLPKKPFIEMRYGIIGLRSLQEVLMPVKKYRSIPIPW